MLAVQMAMDLVRRVLSYERPRIETLVLFQKSDHKKADETANKYRVNSYLAQFTHPWASVKSF